MKWTQTIRPSNERLESGVPKWPFTFNKSKKKLGDPKGARRYTIWYRGEFAGDIIFTREGNIIFDDRGWGVRKNHHEEAAELIHIWWEQEGSKK